MSQLNITTALIGNHTNYCFKIPFKNFLDAIKFTPISAYQRQSELKNFLPFYTRYYDCIYGRISKFCCFKYFSASSIPFCIIVILILFWAVLNLRNENFLKLTKFSSCDTLLNFSMARRSNHCPHKLLYRGQNNTMDVIITI